MARVIITADDYGMCQEVDTAIEQGANKGIITSTNVLVNLESFENAYSLRDRIPNISIGVHWNVTTGKPVSDINSISSLVDYNGYFYPLIEFKSRMRKKLIKKEHLKHEILNQYALFKQACGPADYWNTHENSSLSIPAYKTFSETAKELGIQYTRNFQRLYIDYETVPFTTKIREFMVSGFVNVWFGALIKKDFKMPDAMLFPFNIESKNDLPLLIEKIKGSNKETIEIIVHPAISMDNPLFGNISLERIDEYKFVTRDDIIAEFEKNGIKIVNFTDNV